MRISGLSSDVCASDLFQLLALASHLEHFLLGEAVGVARQLLFQGLQTLDRTGNGLPVGEHAAQPAMVDEMLARLAGGFGDRSEEHTSELQSLMRISYAVFCLKKKINITKET